MGLFQGKQKPHAKPPINETSDGVQQFFGKYFHELRVRGRVYFEDAIDEQVTQFKQDLDATITQANDELKKHIVKRLDEQFAENNRVIHDIQNTTLQSVIKSTKVLEGQHRQLLVSLQKSVANQEAAFSTMFDDSKARMAAIQQAQDTAIKTLETGVKALETQQSQLSALLQKNITVQETALVTAFEENMAQIVEHYLIEAVEEQYDLKAQLPAIIKYMEANKQAIVDDVKL